MADIKKLGEGLWFIIHSLALHATTNELINNYIITMNSLCNHFPCEMCKPDFEKFIKTYPMIYYKHNLFKWSWMLHDMVNKKLNKPQMSYENALEYYKNFTCQNCTVKKDNMTLSSR